MKLQPTTSLTDFHNTYWYLKDLVEFCRRHGIDPTGRKLEIAARVEHFLRTGERQVPAAPSSTSQPPSAAPLTPDTLVTASFKCDAPTRAFFRTLIGDHFHFTAHLQQFRRSHSGPPLTYGDLAREWTAEYERRKDKSYRSKIESTWQYNQFVRDFMADKPRNAGHTIAHAAKAWNQLRQLPGPHTYAHFKRLSDKPH